MAEKSRDAFRTISEVADWLDVPTHVLRFWESRFSQIKPVKRAGGRRYYRPSDMRVIGGVKVLLHDQGMTIRGVQKLFREEGIKHVSGYAPRLFDEDATDTVAPALNEEALELAARPAAPARSTHDAAPDPDPLPEPEPVDDVELPLDLPEDPAPEAEVMFRRRPAPDVTARPIEEKAAEPAEAERVPPAPQIPPTPDVPAIDAADDAEAHIRPPGIAARLRLADPATLLAQREVLMHAAERLRALAHRPD